MSGDAPTRDALRWRMRRLAICAVLAAAMLVQDAGRIVPDTKLDLTADPAGFLAEAASMWDPLGSGGQLQNQAYGYLFPMGPFHLVLQWAGLPSWAVQRLWWALLVCVAFLGAERLARALRVGTPLTRALAAAAFALSPRILSALGPVSAEAWPTALAPWAVLPLVLAARGRVGPLRAALGSGVAVALMGGVNATLTLAAVLPAGLYLLSLRPDRAWRRLAAAWVAAVGAGTLWWVVPLLLQGRYSPPFLDYIENAAATTLPTELTEVIRGTSHWVAFLPPDLGSLWRAGHDLVVQPALIGYTVAAAALGLVGLTLRRLPARGWLLTTFGIGLVFLTWGHVGPLDSPVAQAQRDLLDGHLAPLRNVHKFDVLVRLPLTVGAAHAAHRLSVALRRSPTLRPAGAGLLIATAIVVAGVASPVWRDRVAPLGGYREIPAYWHEAARFVDDHPRGRALLTPSARFASFVWGATQDEPFQALSHSPWDVRNAIPLTPVGHIRMLDAVDARLASGRPSPALARILSRQGFGYVVVRHDLDVLRADSVRPGLLDAVLARSPGFTRVAGFGPTVDDLIGDDPNRTPPALRARQVVEVWRVDPAPAQSVVAATEDLVEVVGGPESVLDAEEALGLRSSPTVLRADAAGLPRAERVVLTDSLRRREVDVGRSSANLSATLTARDDGVLHRREMDYLTPGLAADRTVLEWDGALDLTTSSSLADIGGWGGSLPQHGGAAAVDGDAGTEWLALGARDDPSPWLRVDLGATKRLGTIAVRLPPETADRISSLEVRIDGRALAPVTPTEAVRIPDAGSGRVVQIGLRRAPGTDGAVGLAEVALDGAPVRPTLRMPAVDIGDRAAAIVMSTPPPVSSGCLAPGATEGSLHCSALFAGSNEEAAGIRRVLEVTGTDTFRPHLAVLPRAGPALDALVARSLMLPVTATASSAGVADLSGGPLAAVDGRSDTAWVAGPYDLQPTLDLSFAAPRRIERLRLAPPDPEQAARPVLVRVTTESGGRRASFVREVADDGALAIPAATATRLRIEVLRASLTSARDPVLGVVDRLPVGIAEVGLGGSPAPRIDESALVTSACGEGPTLVVDETVVPTRVHTTVATLRAGSPVPATPCGTPRVELGQGEHLVAFPSTDVWQTSRVTLVGSRWTPPGPARAGGSPETGVRVPADATLVSAPVTSNPGWTGRVGARRATPVVVDGWQQGMLTGDARVTGSDAAQPGSTPRALVTHFAPDGGYRAGLLGGLGLLVCLLTAWLLTRVSRPPPGTRHAALHPRTPAAATGMVAAAGCGLLLGGPAGLLLVALATVGLGAVGDERRPRVRAAVAALTLLAAGAVLATVPWGSPERAASAWLPQAFSLAAVAPALAVPARLRRGGSA